MSEQVTRRGPPLLLPVSSLVLKKAQTVQQE